VRDDHQDRPEHLLLRDLAVRVHVGEQGRGIEVAGIHLLAAGHQRGAGRDRPPHHAVHLVPLPLADQRAHVVVLVRRVAVGHPAERGGDLLDDRVMLLARHQHPGRDRAALPGVRAGRERGDGKRSREVGVVEDDHCGLAAQLEEHALDGAAGGRHDPAAGGGRPGECDDVDVWRRGEHLADGYFRGGDHVDHARRDFGVLGDQLAERERDQRVVRRGLEHHRAAGGERGRQLGEGELRRVVVADDGGDDAGRLLLDPAAVPLAAELHEADFLGQRVVGQQVRVVADDPDRLVELRAVGDHPGRAHVGDRQLAQLLLVLGQHPVQLVQAAGAQFYVGRPRRGVERPPGGGDGDLCVGHRRVGRMVEDLTCGRVDRRVGPVGRDQLPVDEHAVHR
jgi:hypothetical protein